MAPSEPKPPDPHHLAPPFIPCCLKSGSQEVGNRLDSWVFVIARFHEDSGMVILASTVSSLKCMSSVSGRSTGELKGNKFRSVAVYGDTVRTEAQISFRSPSLSFSLSADAWLVDGFCPLFCEGEKSDYCLIRTFKIDSTHPLDFGWVGNISYSGFFVTVSRFRIMPWFKSKQLICEACFGQRSIFYPAIGYTCGDLFRILDSRYNLMLGLRCLYGAVCILSWFGSCWIMTLKVSSTLILVTQLKCYLHFIWPFCSGSPCRTSRMFVCVDVFDYGWVWTASNSGPFVSGSFSCIMSWPKSIPLNCKEWIGQRSTIRMALEGYPRRSLLRILDHRYVLMLDLLRFYGVGCILSWIGYCWVFPLRVSTTLSFVAQLKGFLHYICHYCSGFPCYSSLYWYLDGLPRCLEPCWVLSVPKRELLLFIVGSYWHIYNCVIYSVSAHISILLYCIVLARALLHWQGTWWVSYCVGFSQIWHYNVMHFNVKLKLGFLWSWLSSWLVIISNGFCQVWQYYSKQFMTMAILSLNFICWLAEFMYAPLDGWLLYWFAWCWADLGAVEGCVPGVALLPSVAPCLVEQPRSRAPRCYLLWFPGSMRSTSISETLSLVFMVLLFYPPRIWAIMWRCDYICVHMFNLSFVEKLCWCSLLKLTTWSTELWIGDTVIAFIQLSWVMDQGSQSDAWIIFYHDCITIMVLVKARMYCLMYIISYMLLSVFLMVSENPGVGNPCGVSKAFLSTAFGFRLSLDYCFARFDIFITLCRPNGRTVVDRLTIIDMYFHEDN